MSENTGKTLEEIQDDSDLTPIQSGDLLLVSRDEVSGVVVYDDPDLSDLTGLATGMATFLATPSSANLLTALTDETGSGLLVFNTSCSLVTPLLGTPTSGNLSNCVSYPLAQLTGAGTGVLTFLATPSSANLITALTDETGSGLLVFNNTPTFISPVLGTPTSGLLSNCTGLPLTTGITGTLGTINGGTGVTSVTIAPTASSFAGWDTNRNLSADMFLAGYTSTVTAAGTTTLTVNDTEQQVFTGSTTQTVLMPVVSTLALGTEFQIVNISSGVVTVQSSGANTIQAMAANTSMALHSNATSGTGASVWTVKRYVPANSDITGSGSLVRATSPTFTTPILGTPTSGALTNCTNYPLVQLTGAGTGVLTFLATPSSANLAAALTDKTGSGANVFATSPTLITPVLGAASATSLSFSSTSGVIGTTTNDNATALSVGEVISSIVSGVAITSGVNTNITSISLTAGDWHVYGNMLTSLAAGTTQSGAGGSISTTSATHDFSYYDQLPFAAAAGQGIGLPIPSKRVSIASTTTVYLVGFVTYAVSTLTIGGTIVARRVR